LAPQLLAYLLRHAILSGAIGFAFGHGTHSRVRTTEGSGRFRRVPNGARIATNGVKFRQRNSRIRVPQLVRAPLLATAFNFDVQHLIELRNERRKHRGINFKASQISAADMLCSAWCSRSDISGRLTWRVYPRETQEMVFDAHDRAFAMFICRLPSFSPASLRRMRSIAAGSTQSLKGARCVGYRVCGPAPAGLAATERSGMLADNLSVLADHGAIGIGMKVFGRLMFSRNYGTGE
jgi:hypothetical protein